MGGEGRGALATRGPRAVPGSMPRPTGLRTRPSLSSYTADGGAMAKTFFLENKVEGQRIYDGLGFMMNFILAKCLVNEVPRKPDRYYRKQESAKKTNKQTEATNFVFVQFSPIKN